jgi:hypothetical protein
MRKSFDSDLSQDRFRQPRLARRAAESGKDTNSEIVIATRPAAVVVRGGGSGGSPDYSQLKGGRVALKQEISPREVRLNVDQEWPDGHRVQSGWTLRLEDGQWKFPPGTIPPAESLQPRVGDLE